MSVTAYPLQWPANWPRTDRPQPSNFGIYSFERMRREVLRELRLLKATDVVISTDLKLRADGWPYSKQRTPDDRGVAVYFKLNGRDQCIPCDKWSSPEDNMRAVSKTIEALRGIDRWGAKEMMNAAFTGFQALPASTMNMPASQNQNRSWWEVLGINSLATHSEIKAAYRERIRTAHPDGGGSEKEFEQVQRAYKEGMGDL